MTWIRARKLEDPKYGCITARHDRNFERSKYQNRLFRLCRRRASRPGPWKSSGKGNPTLSPGTALVCLPTQVFSRPWGVGLLPHDAALVANDEQELRRAIALRLPQGQEFLLAIEGSEDFDVHMRELSEGTIWDD